MEGDEDNAIRRRKSHSINIRAQGSRRRGVGLRSSGRLWPLGGFRRASDEGIRRSRVATSKLMAFAAPLGPPPVRPWFCHRMQSQASKYEAQGYGEESLGLLGSFESNLATDFASPFAVRGSRLIITSGTLSGYHPKIQRLVNIPQICGFFLLLYSNGFYYDDCLSSKRWNSLSASYASETRKTDAIGFSALT